MVRLGFFILTLLLLGCPNPNRLSPNQVDAQALVQPDAAFVGRFVADDLNHAAEVACPSLDDLRVDENLNAGQSYFVDHRILGEDDEYGIVTHGQVVIDAVTRSTRQVAKTVHMTDSRGRPAWIKQNCTFTRTGEQCLVVTTSPNLRSSLPGRSGRVPRPRRCRIPSAQASEVPLTVRIGSYTFADGSTFSATEATTTSVGEVVCAGVHGRPDVHLGMGTLTSHRISSREVPNMDKLSCGAPGVVFQYTEIRLANGKVVSMQKYELQALSLKNPGP